MHRRPLSPIWAVLALLAPSVGCSSSKDDEPGQDGAVITMDASSAVATDASSSIDSSTVRPPRRDASSGADAAAQAEICDGIDNDGDGQVDDVDVGGDGVCDCLLLATLGVPGKFGQGNVFADWLNTRSNAGAVSLDGKPLTSGLLAPYRVIVVQDIHEMQYTDAEISALQDWVRAGGGLFTLSGYAEPTERTNVNRILTAVNISYGDSYVLASVGMTTPVTTWFPHPVTDGISKLGAAYGYDVLGGGSVLASEGTVTALRAAELEHGRVLVWTDEWITYNSEWSEHPDYQVERFWLNALKWLSPPQECQVTIPVF